MARAYRSVTSQTLHYLSRPHERICREPLAGPAAWRGAELADDPRWREPLGSAEIEELLRATRVAAGSGKPLQRIERDDFPLPTLAARVASWRHELREGRGFAVIAGVPVDELTPAQAEVLFWGLGLHLGLPGAQDKQGELIGHVRDVGAGDRERLYKTSARIAYHCDAADGVGLLCLQRAKEGGASRLVSSVTIYDELLARRPDLIDELYRPMLLDAHGNSGIDYVPVPICRWAEGKLRTFYHSDYFRSARRYGGAPPLSPRQRELLEVYDEIGADPQLYLDMDLAPGDIQLVSNHTVLHGRTAYVDHDEPDKRRHLLRLWLSFPQSASLRGRLLTAASRVELVVGLLRAVVSQRLLRRIRAR